MTVRDVPENLSQWSPDVLDRLIRSQIDENQWLEFKQYFLESLPAGQNIRDYKRKLEELFCSFANAKGGFIIFGLTDDKPRKIKGVHFNPSEELNLKVGDIINNSTPRPMFESALFEVNGKSLLVVQVMECLDKPVACSNGSYHIRLNGRSEPIPRDYLRDIFVSAEVKKQTYDRLKFEVDYLLQLIRAEPSLVSAPRIPLFYKLRLDDLQLALSGYYGYLTSSCRDIVDQINQEIIKLRKENELFKFFLLVEEKKRYGQEYTTLRGFLEASSVTGEFAAINSRIAESFTSLKLLLESLLESIRRTT